MKYQKAYQASRIRTIEELERCNLDMTIYLTAGIRVAKRESEGASEGMVIIMKGRIDVFEEKLRAVS